LSGFVEAPHQTVLAVFPHTAFLQLSS